MSQARRYAIAVIAGLAAAAAVSAGTIASASTTASPPDPGTSATTGTVSTADTASSIPPTTADTVNGAAPSTPTTSGTTPAPTDTTAANEATTTAPSGATTPAPGAAPPATASPAPPPPPAPLPPTATSGPTAPVVPSVSAPQGPQAPGRAGDPQQRLGGAGSDRSRVLAPAGRRRQSAHHAPAPGASHDTSQGPTTAPPVLTPWAAPVSLDPFTADQIAHFESIGASLDQPPAFLVPIYRAAGRRYHIPWQILAAINAIETDYGRDLNVSVAGAIGWMQFEPDTWLQYGIRVHGSGPPNPYDPADAIFSAARYLAANGAPEHLREALFAYNHALWYVDAVLWRTQLITDRSLATLSRAGGYALPLDARYMRILGRTDDGVDIETAPDGAAVYSITPGIVTAVASDPAGFGPNYPVILVTAGPLAGQYIYFGHVAASLVHVGEHVLAGQPIAVVGHTGNAAGLGHGHIEIGFSDGSGDPLNHGGATAWTPAGDAMRHVLDALATRFRIAGSTP